MLQQRISAPLLRQMNISCIKQFGTRSQSSLRTFLRSSSSSSKDVNRRAFSSDQSKDIHIKVPPTFERPSFATKRKRTTFEEHLASLISVRGPLPVATYMKQVLTNPQWGYYINRDVIGSHGDFITSPEISQVFGELIGIWCITVWQQMKSPPKLNIVELGPGRGTLMSDLLRTAKQFPNFFQTLDVHFVEVSPALRFTQRRALGLQTSENIVRSADGTQVKVSWYDSWSHLKLEGPAIIIAQEFFDCLPVHQFEFTEKGWCEKLVDLDPTESENHFRYTISPTPTFASAALLKGVSGKIGDEIEVCPEGMALAQDIANYVGTHGGASLIIDYGQDHPVGNSLRAIRGHEFRDIFASPGKDDLSCYVDFSALKKAVSDIKSVKAYGAISQAWFLHQMGIETRLEVLLQNASSESEKEQLISGCQRLVDPEQMGQRYKVLSIVNAKQDVPAAFEHPEPKFNTDDAKK